MNLIRLLYEAGFRGESLKKAWAIAMKESGGRASAYNGNRGTGDQSYGLFQINMLGSMGPARRRQFGLKRNEDLFDPVKNARAAFKLSKGGKDFGAWGVGPNAYRDDSARFNSYYSKFPGKGEQDIPVATTGPPSATLPGKPGEPLGLIQFMQSRPGAAQHLKLADVQPSGLMQFLQGRSPGVKAGKETVSVEPTGLMQFMAGRPKTVKTGGPQPHTDSADTAREQPGGGWGGSYNLATNGAQIAKANGLSVISEKRSTKRTASGGVSDHWEGSKDAYAYDLSNGSSPTPEMDRTAQQLAATLGVQYDGKSELVLTKVIGKYRYQILYRTQIGGDHSNHIHWGVRLV